MLTLHVPPANIRQFGYRVSEDRPVGFAASEPMVLLRSGDRLAWTECRTKLSLTGPWGAIDLSLRGLRRIERADADGRTHRAHAASMRPSISAATANENEIEKPT